VIKLFSIIGLFCGLLLLTALIVWQGAGDILGLFMASGWPLLFVVLAWSPSVFLGTTAWRYLFKAKEEPKYRDLFMALWMGRAINTLLPVASIGGEVVKARMLIQWGYDKSASSASVVVDKTIQVLALIIWGVIGVGLLVNYSVDLLLAKYALIGFAVLGGAVALFLLAQQAGLFSRTTHTLHKITGMDFFDGLKPGAGKIDQAVKDCYSRRSRFWASLLWRMAMLVLQSAEVWVAALVLGHPITVMEAIFLKSLTSTISDIAFVVPNAYGLQEGAYVVFGAFIGLPAELALAMSLATRLRELIFDLPGLLIWQHAEGKHFFRRRKAADKAAP